jgi:hypothetical protein
VASLHAPYQRIRFFQTENTKWAIFEQNRLIACQTQEKNQKKKLVWQVMTLYEVAENRAFCK